jgi:hypothetical protein
MEAPATVETDTYSQLLEQTQNESCHALSRSKKIKYTNCVKTCIQRRIDGLFKMNQKTVRSIGCQWSFFHRYLLQQKQQASKQLDTGAINILIQNEPKKSIWKRFLGAPVIGKYDNIFFYFLKFIFEIKVLKLYKKNSKQINIFKVF